MLRKFTLKQGAAIGDEIQCGLSDFQGIRRTWNERLVIVSAQASILGSVERTAQCADMLSSLTICENCPIIEPWVFGAFPCRAMSNAEGA
jgi:hypothetical protein